MECRRRFLGLLIVLVVLSFGLLEAQAETTAVSSELATVLKTAQKKLQKGQAHPALQTLKSWTGEKHSALFVLMGHAQTELNELDNAKASYHAALKIDPDSREAKIALAHVAGRQGDWKNAVTQFSRLIQPHESSLTELQLYTHSAYKAADRRLASKLTEIGLLRFPHHQTFRKLDVALLIEQGRYPEASSAALGLLSFDTGQPQIWKQLAFAQQEMKHDQHYLAALEAAHMASPNDRKLLYAHIHAQHGAGHHEHALEVAKTWVQKRGNFHSFTRKQQELMLEVAEAAQAETVALKWLAEVPPAKRSKHMILVEAKARLKKGERKRARVALETLLNKGENDTQLFIWAGRLAEQDGALNEAEALYRQAVVYKDKNERMASLHLAHFLTRNQQLREASKVIGHHLRTFPGDLSAKKLLELVETH
ncbi:MAG: tetratricopeptide repeat protein [Myxococcota bacterium]|nr:tetratricopeptide repeat protein [Myxococcota bacterium]